MDWVEQISQGLETIVYPESNGYVEGALSAARELHRLADRGEEGQLDDGCRVLTGVIRDCAYKIGGSAERERDRRKLLGRWADSR